MQQMGQVKAITLGLSISLLAASNVLAVDENTDIPVYEGTSASAENQKAFRRGVKLAVGVEAMSGDTTYSFAGPTIGGYNSPLSELEWPLDIWLARIDASLDFNNSWRITGTIKKNISDPGDTMKDSDWLTASNPGQLDVYSESNISDFDAIIWDLDVEWAFLQRESFFLYAGAGYQYQKFEYDGQLNYQFSPSGYPGYEVSGDGSVGITYEMTYKMPYVLLGTEFKLSDKFSIDASFKYAPRVDGDDEDHHLARTPPKEIKGDYDGGYAYMFDMSGKYHFTPSWFVEAGFHYTKINIDGTQTQHYLTSIYAPDFSSGLPQDAESTQTSGSFTVGYKF